MVGDLREDRSQIGFRIDAVQLGPLLSKFAGNQRSAFNAAQSAANAELAAGRLVLGPNGVLPSAGNLSNVRGVPVQLSEREASPKANE